jgi:hypothetical protein
MTDDQGPTYRSNGKVARFFNSRSSSLWYFRNFINFFFCAQSPLSYLISHPFVIKGMSFFFFFLSFGSDDRIRLTHKRETGIRVVAFVSLVSLLLF